MVMIEVNEKKEQVLEAEEQRAVKFCQGARDGCPSLGVDGRKSSQER